MFKWFNQDQGNSESNKINIFQVSDTFIYAYATLISLCCVLYALFIKKECSTAWGSLWSGTGLLQGVGQQWTILRNIEQSFDSTSQYWAISWQYFAILSSQWTVPRNIEQSVDSTSQYLAVSGQYRAILSRQRTVPRNIEQSADSTAQYWAVSGQ